jgi:hypothetical protein
MIALNWTHHTHTLALLWTSDHSDGETSTWQQTTFKRDNPVRIRTCNPSTPTAANTWEALITNYYKEPKWERLLWRTEWVSAPHIHFTTSVNFMRCLLSLIFYYSSFLLFNMKLPWLLLQGRRQSFNLSTRRFGLLKCVNKKCFPGKLNIEYAPSMCLNS